MPDPTTQSRLSRDILLAEYHTYGVPEERWLIGGEFERHLLRPDGTPVPYFGKHGVAWLLETLAENGGWTRIMEGEHIIALTRNGASVTLEPGSQFELSGRPFDRISELATECRNFNTEVAYAIGQAPIHQVALGLTPYANIGDIPWVPKGRYVIMRDHLGATGSLAHHMMKGTCAVQATYDFSDEADCAQKVSIATSLGPLITALFANSPISEGKPNGFASFRGHIWTQTDPARTGFPEAAENFTFERWLDYLLDVPMMFLHKGDRWIPAKGLSFRDWMDNGIDGWYPVRSDWDLHLTSVFPEVRVKQGIEVRGADCVSMPLALGFTALFKGLFYCSAAVNQATELAAEFRHCGTKEERFAVACRGGLEGTVGDKRLSEWAERLLTITWDSLGRCAPHDRAWLSPIIRQINRGVSPSADVLAAYAKDPSPSSLIRASEFGG